MTISAGDTLPDATLLRMGADGPEEVTLSTLTRGRKVVVFGLPGAFTGVCTTAHVPSFIRTRDDLAAKGVDEVICVAVNDPFVLKAWTDQTGAEAGGIVTLGDPQSAFTTAIGMNFTAPAVGFVERSRRYAMIVEDNRVVEVMADDSPGTCDLSGGETVLAAL